MKKENKDVDYPLEYYCEQCCRYGYCKIIKEHERNRTRLYNRLEKSEYLQQTLLPIDQIREENKPNRFIQILNEFKGSLDKVLRCLKKRNYLHKRYSQAKTGYPCFS